MGVTNGKYKNKYIRISYNLNKDLLCYKCGLISEILNAHSDKRKIELNCKKCGVNEILIDQYLDRLSKIISIKNVVHVKIILIIKNIFIVLTARRIIVNHVKIIIILINIHLLKLVKRK